MSRIRDIANILSGVSTDMATDAEVAASYASKTNPTFTAIGGDEGGQINFAAAATNTTLSGPISVDIYQNKIRFFENGGSSRGSYINLANQANGAGSEIITGASQSGNSGKYLTTNGTTAVWQENKIAGKNKIINGDFSIWQRGTTITAGTYTADRWVITGGAGTVTRQPFTPGSAPVSGYEAPYYLNWTITANQQNNEMIQRIEDARTFAGQTVTLSFWARSTVGSQPQNVAIYQHFGTGGSPSSIAPATLISGGSPYTPTASWQRFSFTFTIPSVTGKTFGTNNDSFLWVRPAQMTATTTNTSLDIWGIQLEAGTVATSFETSTGTIQQELAACQRYYLRHSYSGTNSALIGPAYARTTGIAFATWTFPVTMRSTPTLAFSNGTQYFNLSIAAGDATFNTLSGSSAANTDRASLRADAGAHTIGQAGVLGFNNSAAWIEASAEL
jgi:hypothetical protein